MGFSVGTIYQKIDGDPSISGKKTVEESLMEASGIRGVEVLQDGLFR